MRPLDRGLWPTVNGVAKEVKDYGDLREDLYDALGGCCSYCELPLTAKPEVEHVAPKAHNPDARVAWGNLLLACGFCNPEKSDRDIDRSTETDYVWPDRDNTFRAFVYSVGGVVKPDPTLPRDLQLRALRTRDLVGLNPRSSTPARVRRWNLRRAAWDRIVNAREDLRGCNTPEMRRQLVEHARSLGYWSMWMTVFADDPQMRAALLGLLRGTAGGCFDAAGRPVPRRGGVL